MPRVVDETALGPPSARRRRLVGEHYASSGASGGSSARCTSRSAWVQSTGRAEPPTVAYPEETSSARVCSRRSAPERSRVKDQGWTDDYVCSHAGLPGRDACRAPRARPLTCGRRTNHWRFARARGAAQAGLRHQIAGQHLPRVFAGPVHTILWTSASPTKGRRRLRRHALYASRTADRFTGCGVVPVPRRGHVCIAGRCSRRSREQRFPAPAQGARRDRRRTDRAKHQLAEDVLRTRGRPAALRALGDARAEPAARRRCASRGTRRLLGPSASRAAGDCGLSGRRRAVRSASLPPCAPRGLGCSTTVSKSGTLRPRASSSRLASADAEPFEKLDTCVASHRVTRSEAALPRRATRTGGVQGIARRHRAHGTGAEAEHARQGQTLQAKWQASSNLRGTAEGAESRARRARSAREGQGRAPAERDESGRPRQKRHRAHRARFGARQCVAERTTCIADAKRAARASSRTTGRQPGPKSRRRRRTPRASPGRNLGLERADHAAQGANRRAAAPLGTGDTSRRDARSGSSPREARGGSAPASCAGQALRHRALRRAARWERLRRLVGARRPSRSRCSRLAYEGRDDSPRAACSPTCSTLGSSLRRARHHEDGAPGSRWLARWPGPRAVREEAPLTVGERVLFANQDASDLAAAHARGVVHRDISRHLSSKGATPRASSCSTSASRAPAWPPPATRGRAPGR